MASTASKLTVGIGLVAAALIALGSQALAKGPGHANISNPPRTLAPVGPTTKPPKSTTYPVFPCTKCTVVLPPKPLPPKPQPHARYRYYGGGAIVVSAGYCAVQAERCSGLYGTSTYSYRRCLRRAGC